jgi:hypothetical protein
MVSLQLYQNAGEGPGEPQLVVGDVKGEAGHLSGSGEEGGESTRRCGQAKEGQ